MIDSDELNELHDLNDNAYHSLYIFDDAELTKLLHIQEAYVRAEATVDMIEGDDGSVEPSAMGLYTDASWRMHAYQRDISNLLTDAMHYGYLLEKLLDDDTKKPAAGATATD